jgi:phosphatidylglycerophosphatase A
MGEMQNSWLPSWTRWPITLTASLGVGLLPGPRGTYGSLITAAAAWLWLAKGGAAFAGPWYLVFLLILAVVAVASSQAALNLGLFGGKKDPGQVVIDEALGQMVTYYGLGVTGWEMVAGFFLFRFFDIAKPWPVGKSQDLPGGWGIVIDDFLAGIYALICLQVGMRLIA